MYQHRLSLVERVVAGGGTIAVPLFLAGLAAFTFLPQPAERLAQRTKVLSLSITPPAESILSPKPAVSRHLEPAPINPAPIASTDRPTPVIGPLAELEPGISAYSGGDAAARDSGAASDDAERPAVATRTEGAGATSEAKGEEASARRAAGDDFGARVFRRIREKQTYAPRLARARISGTVVIALEIDGRGRLRSAEIVESSGNTSLDRIAMAQLHAAAPFPTPPAGQTRRFKLPMTYRPRD